MYSLNISSNSLCEKSSVTSMDSSVTAAATSFPSKDSKLQDQFNSEQTCCKRKITKTSLISKLKVEYKKSFFLKRSQ